jgi:hypothetical protein
MRHQRRVARSPAAAFLSNSPTLTEQSRNWAGNSASSDRPAEPPK